MLFLSLPDSITSVGLSAVSLAHANPGIIHGLAEHAVERALIRNLHSHIRKNKMAGLSRARRRKIGNRRRRWFIDNIIMHHKRLHDKNRQTTVDNIRKKALEKREALKKRPPSLKEALSLHKSGPYNWREHVDLKERSTSIRERIDSRRARARSRWSSISDLVDDINDEDADNK